MKAAAFLVTLALLIAATLALTTGTDPYRLYGAQPNKGPDRTDLFWHLRLHKPRRIESLAPDALVIGSSVSGRLSPALIFPDARTAYNAAIPGASMLEVRYMLEHALQAGEVTDIVLGMEYFMFAADYQGFLKGFDQARMQKDNASLRDQSRYIWQQILDYWATAFSRTAIADSFRLRNDPASSNRVFWPDGSWSLEGETLPPGAYYKMLAQQKLREFSRKGQSLDLSSLEDIISLAEQRGAKLSLLLSPYHAYIHNAIAITGNFHLYLDWQRRLVVVAEKHNVPIYGMAANRQMVTADIAGQKDSFLDGAHPRRKMSRHISRCLQQVGTGDNCAQPWTLTRLSSANIDSYLQDLTTIREEYAGSHPDLIKQIRQLAKKVQAGAKPAAAEVTMERQQ